MSENDVKIRTRGLGVSTDTDTTDTDDERRDERAVWITELDRLEREAGSFRNRLVIPLGARAGLQISETVGLRVDDLAEEPVDGDLQYWTSVAGNDPRADTDSKKQRRTWIPSDVWRDLRLQVNEHDLAGDDPVSRAARVDTSPPSRGGGSSRRSRGARTTPPGREKFADVSSRDLRRFWANYLLVGKGANPRVVMRLGGWEDFQSIKPYLDRPRDTTVAREMIAAEGA